MYLCRGSSCLTVCKRWKCPCNTEKIVTDLLVEKVPGFTSMLVTKHAIGPGCQAVFGRARYWHIITLLVWLHVARKHR